MENSKLSKNVDVQNTNELEDIFTPEVISQLKNNKSLITSALLEKLRSLGNKGKQIAIDILDTKKSEDNFYLDAFDKKISYMGDRGLKKAYTQMALSEIHIDEIKRCASDLMYFKDNYVKIRTKKGYDFPETRPYQEEFLNDMIDPRYENIVSLQGRQCCFADTNITVDGENITIQELFESVKDNKVKCFINKKFTESYLENKRKILTPYGYKEIEYVHKTIPFQKYYIETENGLKLNCAENHVIILDDGSECYAKNTLNKVVKTQFGDSKVTKCIDLNTKEPMYDISIKDSESTELYYTNGILSHNSGKSVTVSIYLAWQFVFNHDINIGICANKASLAREFLNNVKVILQALPMWLVPGVVSWNKGSVESEAGMRILTDAPSQNSFRGFTICILVVDEVAFIRSTMWEEFADSVFPSQAALSMKKNILISTPNGINHFEKIVEGAKAGTNGFKYHFVNWKDVPRFDSKGNRLSPEEFKNMIIKRHGLTFFNQNFACQFLGSSKTLVSVNKISELKPQEPLLVRDSKLKVYEEPQKNHNYIMSVDPAKGGLDAFAIHIIDITVKPFIEVAAAQLFNCNFQKMPIFLDEYGRYYNNAFMIIENNEGAGTFINSMLQLDYEYPNLYFAKEKNKKSKEAGFRTTTKSRVQILENLKLFIDNDLIKINDKATVNELYTFVLKNDKYQADDGCHDDMVMSLALAFAPFCNSKNFDDMKVVLDLLYSKSSTSTSIAEHFIIGNFDDFSDDSVPDEKSTGGLTYDKDYTYNDFENF